MPGEASLAHEGVLFLDELTEFRRAVLDVLREPMESGRIALARATWQAEYPARFQLVAAMNPCPCGLHGETGCRCTPDQVTRYQSRLSAPFLERIDLHVDVRREPLPSAALAALADERPGGNAGEDEGASRDTSRRPRRDEEERGTVVAAIRKAAGSARDTSRADGDAEATGGARGAPLPEGGAEVAVGARDASRPESSAAVRARAVAARERQLRRQGRPNATLDPARLVAVCRLDDAGRALIERAAHRFDLSLRGVHRLLRVARTVADLEAAPTVGVEHLREALGYRERVMRPATVPFDGVRTSDARVSDSEAASR